MSALLLDEGYSGFQGLILTPDTLPILAATDGPREMDKMTAQRTYLDHNASAPLLPSARQAACDALDLVGNPSSVHTEGRAMRQLLDTARRQVADLAGAEAKQVVFTGSATEALTQAIVAGAKAFAMDAVLVEAGAHAAVQKAAEATGLLVTPIPLMVDGLIDLDAMDHALSELEAAGRRVLVAVTVVNNETGVIQPMAEITGRVGPHKHILVVDAVQALGKLDLDFGASGIDMMAISGHKIGAPAGIGALLVKAHADEVRLIPGGGQEQQRRGGTEATSLIAGFGAAAVSYVEALELSKRAKLIGEFECQLKRLSPEVEIFGEDVPRVGTVSYFAMPGVQNSVAMMALDLDGIAVSSGSACSSGKVGRSHVLEAMHVAPHLLDSALRISVGWSSTSSDIEHLLAALKKLVARQKSQNGQAA